ncbi:MAG: imidazolonepropionase [Candidatus Thorarchaeota archaeon]|nr:MAG: imidazolonepropionase [Candidatus Thorarchaeota archaeon]
MKPDLLISSIGQLATLAGHSKRPKSGAEMMELSIIEDGAIAIKDGRISAVGKTSDIMSVVDDEATPTMQFPDQLVLPGFVDSHTHLVFGGSREQDFPMKLAGKSYMEILQAGGGILSTLRHTREATQSELTASALVYATRMMHSSATTIEAKSGYGLDLENEVKMMDALNDLRHKVDIDLVSTFMGAHAVPPEYEGKTQDYVDLVVGEMIPVVAERELAEFCDVFCEEGVFDVEQSREILMAAKKVGLFPKVHADEIVQLGGAELAAETGAVSADHLLKSSEDGLEQMMKAGTVATLLPATAFSLGTDYADARRMIDMGLPVALATDFNPNCANESLFFTIALACYRMKMNPREAISAITINGAHALGRGQETGSIEVGKRADVVILDCPNPDFLAWRFGANLTNTVVVNGKVIYTKLD